MLLLIYGGEGFGRHFVCAAMDCAVICWVAPFVYFPLFICGWIGALFDAGRGRDGMGFGLYICHNCGSDGFGRYLFVEGLIGAPFGADRDAGGMGFGACPSE